MPRILRNKETGALVYENPDGTMRPLTAAEQQAAQQSAVGAFMGEFGTQVHEMGQNLGIADAPDQQRMEEINARRTIHPTASGAAAFIADAGVPVWGKGGVTAPLAFGIGMITGDPRDPWYWRGTEGLVGEGIGRTIMHGATKLKNAFRSPSPRMTVPNSAQAEAARTLRGRYGVPTTPGEQAHNVGMRNFETWVDSGLFSSNRMADKKQAVSEVMNVATGKAAGLTDAEIKNMNGRFTQEWLDVAYARNGEAFSRVQAKMPPVTITGETAAELRRFGLNDDLVAMMNRRRRAMQMPPLRESGPLELTGAEVMNLRSDLLTDAAASGKWTRERNMMELIDQLDAAVERQVGPKLGQEYATAREQFRFLKSIDNGSIITDKGVQRADMLRKKMREWDPQYHPDMATAKEVYRTVDNYDPVVRNPETSGSGVALQGLMMAAPKRALEETYYNSPDWFRRAMGASSNVGSAPGAGKWPARLSGASTRGLLSGYETANDY